MNDRRTKHFFKIIITQFGIGSLMFLLGLSLVFYAEGYRFRFSNFKIVKTGLVYVVPNQKVADVYIDNSLVSQKTPYSKNLLPGVYDIKIKKDGFADWNSVVNIRPELVSDFKEIVLFKNSISAQVLTENSKIAVLNSPVDTLATTSNRKLTYDNYQIWVDDQLATRFSEPITKAIWYPDYRHIIYQKGDQIRIIEASGTNDTLLVKLNQKTSTNFAVSKNGDELYFIDNGEYKVASIR